MNMLCSSSGLEWLPLADNDNVLLLPAMSLALLMLHCESHPLLALHAWPVAPLGGEAAFVSRAQISSTAGMMRAYQIILALRCSA